MNNTLTEIQRYFAKYATEKAKIRNATINGKPATITFSEYKATEDQRDELRKMNEADHFYFITISTKSDYINAYYNKKVTITETYVTTKQEGNDIYRQLKATKAMNI